MTGRIRALKKLDRKRLDAALMRIQGRPIMMTLFNLGLVGINSLSNVKRFVMLSLNKLNIVNLDPTTSNDSFNFLPEKFHNRVINDELSVLIVCEVTIPQCFRYRVEQKIEQLELLGWRCKWLNWTDYFEVKNQIHFHDVIIFYRVPGYPKAVANIEYASRLGKIVVYDTDDLIYERQTLESYYNKSTGQLSTKELKAVLKGADLYKQAIQKCQFALTTTPKLKKSLELIIGEENAFILPNALDKYIEAVAKYSIPVKQSGHLTLFYGSGSKTHDEDFILIAGVLARLFDQYDNLHLVVVGYLTVPDALVRYQQRITQIEFLEFNEYFQVLSHADINLAPLKSGLFADCKSEIKWLEAGALSIPTITSATSVYKQAITHGQDGYIAENSEQWLELLERLIANEDLRDSLGVSAAATAQRLYSSQKISSRFSDILTELKNRHIKRAGYKIAQNSLRHIVIVNVLYPPLAMGGATVIAENIVNSLHEKYEDQFRVSVFTCDINNIYAYQLKEYEHKGVTITAVSVPVGPEVDAREYDDYIESIFNEYLEYQNPDLIHFHSIQRLTASILQAATNRLIPFVVTVHDAWWLSDHQFLVDSEGRPVDQLQSNPMIAAKTSINMRQTIHRSGLLKNLLNKAEKVLAVSSYQAEFYKRNGVQNVFVNANGVDNLCVEENLSRHSKKVVLGYSGSICHHKGYYFLKNILESVPLKNIELKVIQFDLHESRVEIWNDIEVEFLPKFDSSNMAKFYQQIDVLIAPSMWPESFGLITREAALAGVWVIASEAGGLAELIKPGENGFKFEIGNAKQLIEILNEIDNNPQRYMQRLSDQVKSSFNIISVEQQIAELVGIYNSVLDKSVA